MTHIIFASRQSEYINNYNILFCILANKRFDFNWFVSRGHLDCNSISITTKTWKLYIFSKNELNFISYRYRIRVKSTLNNQYAKKYTIPI